MTLEERIIADLKTAMKAKDKVSLRGIRAIKSAIMLQKTDGTGTTLDEAGEISMLQKLVKSRQDSLLIQASPDGPTCHTGSDTCWNEVNQGEFLDHLERTIQHRRDNPSEKSYTSQLLARGINKVAQKVGEEAVELVIEAKDDDRDLFLGEAADLMYHYIVLLAAKGYALEDVREVLRSRHK